MTSSSSIPESAIQEATQATSTQQEAPPYEIKGRTMSLEEWELTVQVERLMSKTASARFYRCSNKRYRSDREL